MDKPRSMVIELPAGEQWNGRAYTRLYRELWNLGDSEGPIRQVYFEAPLTPVGRVGGVGFKAVGRLLGLVAVAEMFADCIGAAIYFVHQQSWRRHFYGKGTGLRREQAKRASIERCRSLGWYPQDDNAADALGVLDYAIHLNRIDAPWNARLVLTRGVC